MSTTDVSSLLRHHGDACPEACWVADDRSAAAVERVDVLDEVSDNRPAVRDRVIRMIGDTWTRTRGSVVSGDVKGPEVGNRNGRRPSRCVGERAVRSQICPDDSLVALRETVAGEIRVVHRPVVVADDAVRRTGRRILDPKDAAVESV